MLLNDVAPDTLHGDPQRPGLYHEIVLALALALAHQAELPVTLSSAFHVRLKDVNADMVVGVEGPELESLAQRVAPFHVFKFVAIAKKERQK